jgi:hypothetical protein
MHLFKPIRGAKIPLDLLVALAVLAALALIYFAWPVYRAFLPLQIVYSDSWNAYHADALHAGQPLYVFDDFISNNYPPLSFYVVHALSAATGADVLYLGRLLSLAATAGTAFAVWGCIRQLGASRLAATVGGLWWFATMARWYGVWVGADDPHLVALAIMTGALAYALRHSNDDRATLAILLMAVAGFYKHTLVAIPITTLLWLTLCDRRRGLRATFIGLAAVAVGLLACGLFFGAAFFHDMLLPRHYDLIRGLASIGRMQYIAPALVIAVGWAAYRRDSGAGRFVVLFAAIAFVSSVAQECADGVADTATFELVVASAIGIGCAFHDLTAIPVVRQYGIARCQTVLVLVLIARLLISLRTAPYLLLSSRDFRADLNARSSIMKAESARIAAIPGPVTCKVALACRFAGKRFVYDPFIVGEYVATGRLSEQDVLREVNQRKIRFESVDDRTSISELR